uniref:Serine protease 48 n=1 Tax=Mamestra configurata TaxID=174822 RepID=C9W8I9_9NEOP|nr:serine protease 48 [Mamestra configurata]
MPLAEKLRKLEEKASSDPSRIIGGSLAYLGQFPYQVGLLTENPRGTSLSSAALVSPTRVLTAAHNLNDAVVSVTKVNVVLGSITINTGGTRIVTTDFVLHENWTPAIIRNDVAMVNLPYAVSISNILAPIALPSGSLLNEDFAGEIAIASGFGKTSNDGGVSFNQPLSFVHLPVITNEECADVYNDIFVQPSNVCTSGEGNKNICTGDSGGPLAVTRKGIPILIGITSFGSGDCEASQPSAFARVTSFMGWINSKL